MRKLIDDIGIPRLTISGLLIVILITASFYDLSMADFGTDILKRFGMHAILVLAMVPTIQAGLQLNFASPLGIIAGLIGATLSVELNFTGVMGLFMAIVLSLPFAIIIGVLYGKLLNQIKGSEMTVAPYSGFAIVQLMCIFWIMAPYHSSSMTLPLGKGLRQVFTIDNYFGGVLDNFLSFTIFGVTVPTGLLLFVALVSFLVYIFSISKTGMRLRIAGSNPEYAKAQGIDIDKGRIVAFTLSTVLSAVGIVIYSQSFGFVQLYAAPMYMSFPAVAAILLGGATATKVKIRHVFIGTFLFQSLLATALPTANEIFPSGGISDIIRVIVQYGIILYALTRVSSSKGAE